MRTRTRIRGPPRRLAASRGVELERSDYASLGETKPMISDSTITWLAGINAAREPIPQAVAIGDVLAAGLTCAEVCEATGDPEARAAAAAFHHACAVFFRPTPSPNSHLPTSP